MSTMKSTLTVILILAAAVADTLAKTCETEDYEDGICVSVQKCDEVREAIAEGLTAGQRIWLRREQEKCEDAEQEDLVCCKRKLRPPIPRSYEDRKPLTKSYHDLLPDHTVCGLDSADRIFHGNLTYLDQYPWLVLIKYVDEEENEEFKCGGSLINKRYVLTAAHCINKNIAGVRLGEWDLEVNPDCVTRQGIEQCAPPVLDVGIERIAMHKNYTRRMSMGGRIDLALLRLDRDVAFGKYIAPICLPKTESEATLQQETPMYVAGWGMTENGTASSKKLFVDITYVGLKECDQKINSPLIKIDETMICALGSDGKDACQGDSGGPLMDIQTTDSGVDRFFLKGVVSKGLYCGTNKPGFYMNVFRQLEWIVSNMEA